MHEASRSTGRGRGWRGVLALVALVATIWGACGPTAPAPASTAPGGLASSSPVAVAPNPSAAVASPAPAASASGAPSRPPVLDPERCPPELPPAATTTADGIEIDGDETFAAHVGRALDLLKRRAPASYADVLSGVTRVWQVEAFSGMCYDTGTYRVGDETAYAPGHATKSQVVWLAGTIVHDGCHRNRYVAGQEPSGRDAELACLELQVAALREIEDGTSFGDYVQGLIDTVDDPASQYWTATNRHW